MPITLCGRKLTFGDEEQISLIRRLERDEVEKQEERDAISRGEKQKYKVNVSCEFEETYEIVAASSREAEQIAREMARDDFDEDFSAFATRIH